jgi:excisionase family DNA binding protein
MREPAATPPLAVNAAEAAAAVLPLPSRPAPAGPPGPALLVDAVEAARLLNIGKSLFFALKSSGRLPAPVRLGRCVRWNRDTLIAWCAAGCPSAERFEALTRGSRR